MQLNLPTLATIPSNKNSNGYVTLLLNDNEMLTLVDSGSTSNSFIGKSLVHQFNIELIPAKGEISLANSSLTSKIEECLITFTLKNNVYENVKVLIMGKFCADIILGQNFMERHESVVFTFNRKEPTLQVCALKVVSATFLLVCFVCLKESTFETFCFTWKALLLLEIIKF